MPCTDRLLRRNCLEIGARGTDSAMISGSLKIKEYDCTLGSDRAGRQYRFIKFFCSCSILNIPVTINVFQNFGWYVCQVSCSMYFSNDLFGITELQYFIVTIEMVFASITSIALCSTNVYVKWRRPECHTSSSNNKKTGRQYNQQKLPFSHSDFLTSLTSILNGIETLVDILATVEAGNLKPKHQMTEKGGWK